MLKALQQAGKEPKSFPSWSFPEKSQGESVQSSSRESF